MSNDLLEELSERLSYDPVSGEFTWNWSSEKWFKDARAQAIWNTRYAGKKACHSRKDGRVVIGIRSQKLFAHRVAYAIMNGRWPEGEIDHINGDATDNRAANLRDVDKSGNMRNQRRNCTNKTGQTGVCRRGSKWGAYINYDGSAKWLGTYRCKTSAVVARKLAEAEHGYHENHGRSS